MNRDEIIAKSEEYALQGLYDLAVLELDKILDVTGDELPVLLRVHDYLLAGGFFIQADHVWNERIAPLDNGSIDPNVKEREQKLLNLIIIYVRHN